MANFTKEVLMKKSVEEIINLVITQQETINDLKTKKASTFVIENNQKVRKENTELKRELQKYKTLVEKLNLLGVVKETKKDNKKEKKEEQPQN